MQRGYHISASLSFPFLCLTELFMDFRMAEESSTEETEDNSCEDGRTHGSNCGLSADAPLLSVFSLVCSGNQHYTVLWENTQLCPFKIRQPSTHFNNFMSRCYRTISVYILLTDWLQHGDCRPMHCVEVRNWATLFSHIADDKKTEYEQWWLFSFICFFCVSLHFS